MAALAWARVMRPVVGVKSGKAFSELLGSGCADRDGGFGEFGHVV